MKINNAFILLFYSIFLFSSFNLLGQEYKIEISEVSGIDESIVNDVEQDINGFIWIATNQSIYRKSNKNFLKFSPEKLHIKPTDITINATSDANGNIWYYAKNDFKLQILNIKKNKAFSIKEAFPNLPFSEINIIDKIYRDELFHIYISVKNKGLYKFDGKNILLVKLIEDKNNKPIYHVSTELYNWFAFDKKIIRQNKRTLFEEKFSVDNTILSAHIFNNEAIFTEAGVFPQKTFQVKRLENSKSTNLFPKLNLQAYQDGDYRIFQKTSNNTYWINEVEYLTQFDENKKIILRIKKDELPFKERYRSFFVDKNNIVWVITATSLYKVVVHKNNFKKYLDGYSLKSIFKRDATFYISNFSSGLKTLTPQNKIKQYNYLEDNYSFYGAVYQKDTLWISTGMRLFNHNFKTKKTIEYTKDKEVDNNKISFGIMARHPKTKTVFIGSFYYLIKIDENKKNASVVKKLDAFLAKKDRNNINVRSLQVSGDSIWIGTSKGLFLMNHKEEISRAITPKNGLPKNLIIQYIFVEDKNTIWLATQGQGLVKWNRLKNSFKIYTTKDGLSNNNVYAIFKDDFGFFWLPTDNGLNRFAPKTLKNKVFLPNEISDKEFNHLSNFKDKDGTLYLGGINGLTVFNPKDFLGIKNVPHNLMLNKLKTTLKDNTTIENTNIENNVLSINSDVKKKELEFLLLDFNNNLPLQYQYKITPLHNDYIVAENNKIILPNLEKGNYQLYVKAQSSDGSWTALKKPIKIISSKNNSVFYLKATLVLLGVAFFIFFLLNRKKSKNKKKNTEKNNESDTKISETEHLIKAVQDDWLNKLNKIILENMNSINFGMEFLSDKMELGERQLQRRIKKYTNLTPNKYITEVKLAEAFRLIEEKEVNTVKELANKVGFSTTDYFSKLFKNKYHKNPSDLLNF